MVQKAQDPLSANDKAQLDRMLSVSGEMGALIRALDWSQTPLGPIETWPQSLWTAVSICLFSRFPIHIWWGPEFVELYNDAYRPILGVTKHPASLGKPGAETSADIWHIIGPMLGNVYENAIATWSDNLMLPMDRYGFTEETYFTLSYSPIFVETGTVGGIFTVVTETTRQVLGERRLQTLHRLSERTNDAKTAEDACRLAADELAHNLADIPFSLLYLLDESAPTAVLVGSAGVEAHPEVSPQIIDLTAEYDSVWKLKQVLAEGQTVQVDHLPDLLSVVPSGPWDEPPNTALVLPIAASGLAHTAGFLIVGVSARLALNDDYRHFFELVAGHISTAVANARAYEHERKRAEALAELDRAKTEFFSNVSHEFRTPLTLMVNPLLEVLNSGETLSEEQWENLETAYRNSLRLQKLVNTLLDFSRIQSNRIRAAFEPTDLAALTSGITSSFRSVVDRAGLRLSIDCPPLREPVYVDREMWEKIVMNLISNAFKFTFQGEIGVSLHIRDRFAELKVRDTGIGISEADLPHIFERFHRVHGARSRSYEGSGIGLALVAELVRFHGGQIDVVSTPGEGTTFSVSIPLGSAHLPQDQISAPRTLESTAGSIASYTEEAMRWLKDDEREKVWDAPPNTVSDFEPSGFVSPVSEPRSDAVVLIVDDNADMRDYLRRLLGQRYHVETANDGIDALARIEKSPPDLVVTDVMMPNLDGFGLLKRLRSNDQTRTLPVLLLSARAGEEARIEGMQAGANDYLTKPFSARELVASVAAQLQLLRLRRETQTAIENIVEGIADPFFALDRDWRYVYVNQRARQLWDMPSRRLIGSNIWDIFPEGVGTPAHAAMYRAVETQQPNAFENYSTVLKRWVEINLYPSSTGLAVYFRDIHERKQMEEAARIAQAQLIAEQQRLIDIFESISDAFTTLDKEYRYTYMNPKGVELLYKLSGKNVGELMGETVWDTFPGSYESPFGALYRRVMEEGIPAQLQAFFPPLDTWFDVRIYPSKEGLSIYFTDITEQQKTQMALRESEERFRAFVTASSDVVYRMSADWSEMRQLQGRDFIPDTVSPSRTWLEAYIHPDDRPLVLSKVEEAVRTKTMFQLEHRVLRLDGSIGWTLSRAVPLLDADGEIVEWFGTASDMTDRKLAVERTEILQRLTAELSAETAPLAMATAIVHAVYSAVGEAFASVYLISPDGQAIDRLFSEGLPPSYQPKYSALPLNGRFPSTDAVRGGEIVQMNSQEEYLRRYPHLKEMILNLNIHALIALPLMLDEDVLGCISLSFQHPRHFSSQERDLLIAIAHLCAQALRRAQLYEAEARARHEAEEANALKLKFLGMISHELRTPLASIKGFASTLLADDVSFSPEKQQQFLRIIDEESDRLTNLVEQLLEMSRLQSGTLRIEQSAQSINTILHSAMTQLQTLTAQHRLDIAVPPDLPDLLADPHRIAQVIVNLVGNAVKFSPIGTQITISAAQVDRAVRIDVIDQGIGIPPEAREKVFEAFQQVERKNASNRLGTGLGLAICKSIVEAHGGRIWIQDQPVGTTISFTLPVAAASE